MRKINFVVGAVSLVALVAVPYFSSGSSGVSEIRHLAKRGASETTLLSKVEKAPKPYALTADDIIALKKDGVPDTVVVKMIRHKP